MFAIKLLNFAQIRFYFLESPCSALCFNHQENEFAMFLYSNERRGQNHLWENISFLRSRISKSWEILATSCPPARPNPCLGKWPIVWRSWRPQSPFHLWWKYCQKGPRYPIVRHVCDSFCPQIQVNTKCFRWRFIQTNVYNAFVNMILLICLCTKKHLVLFKKIAPKQTNIIIIHGVNFVKMAMKIG